MSPLAILLLCLLGFGAGSFGALAGVGGGVIITPVLVMYFGLPIHQAIGVSLVSVIATSTAASAVNVERQVADIRLGMTLELATTIGAAIAAIIAGSVDKRTLAVLFCCFLGYSAFSMAQKVWRSRKEAPTKEIPPYEPTNYPAGMGVALLAGGFSGLLGVGGGVIKVPAMFLFMKVPLRVATATSNFMIGVTAATSAYIYYGRGDVSIVHAAPIVSGVFAGSFLGARLAPRVRSLYVTALFVLITGWMTAQMIMKLIQGKL